MKLDFVNPLGAKTGPSTLAIPESRMEIGLGGGFQAVFQEPLLRLSEPNGTSVLAAGQFSVALEYLLAGSPTGRYAISVLGRLEVPTGDSTVVGNEIQLMPMVLAEWHPVARVLLQSNLAWNTTVTGSTGRFANLEYSNAAVWLATRHFLPALEFAGSTNTINGVTQLVIVPELIVARVRHFEFKTGLSVALMPSPHYGLRSQIAWSWGKRY